MNFGLVVFYFAKSYNKESEKPIRREYYKKGLHMKVYKHCLLMN